MINYIIRRIAYALPILIGVNVITFVLFFVVNTPDDMARMHLGIKRVTPEAIEKWKNERGYDKPVLWNSAAGGIEKITDTIFVEHSARLFIFDFGRSDNGRDISYDISQRMWPSLAITIPSLILGLLTYITFALILAFFRASYIDIWGVVICVFMMSISSMFYIIGGQFVIGKLLHLVPISGYDTGIEAIKFILLPIFIGLAV
jgi:peptide/nickel transport system permease protein